MAGQDNNIIADLNIRLGVVTDASGLTKFVKDIQKNIDKATFNNGKKKDGFSNNFTVLENGVKRYRKLIEETYKQAEKLSLTENGGFKRNLDGSISDIEKAYKKLQKGARELEGAFAKADPTSLQMSNKMRAAQLRSISLDERILKQKQREKIELLQITAEMNKHNTLLSGMTRKFGQLGGMVRQYLNLWSVRAYLMNILNITAEFERQRRALGSLINDQSQAISMFGEIKNMALNSPYTTLELTRTAKGLAAYDIETKDLIKDTKMLGDVASATGVDIQRLVLAYGQVKTATWLKGQEARQFSEAGVPILRALANRYSATEGRTVTTREVQERMSNRQISFEDVQAALRAMTEEGGKFYNMQETIAETTYGKIQKISDAWQQGFERMANGGFINTLINGALDGIVKIAKNISSIVPHLLAISAAMLVINQRGKLSTSYAEKELALLKRKKMLEKQYNRWNDEAFKTTGDEKTQAQRLSSYYKSQITSVETSISKQRDFSKILHNINVKINENAQSVKFWNKRVKVLGLTFQRLYVTAKQVLINMKRQLMAFVASNWITLLLFGLVEVFNLIRNIGAKTRQLNNDLKEIEIESAKKTKELTSGFEKYAKVAVSAADGSKKQADALSSLTQLYGEIIPLESLSIENLKAMNGEYGSLTKQIELYQKIQEGNEKRKAIIESDKYKDDFKEAIHSAKYKLKTKNRDGSTMYEKVSSDTLENVATSLLPEIDSEQIKSIEEYKKRVQEELAKMGYTVEIKDIRLSDDFIEAFEEMRKKAGTDSIKELFFGEGNAKLLSDQEKLINSQKVAIDNAKTGKEVAEGRNKLLEQYADTMSKIAQSGISKANAMKFIMGEINSEILLQGTNLDKDDKIYGQILQTVTAMKNNFLGLYDGVDMFSVKSKEVLDIWKDSLITVQDLKVVLSAGKDDPYENYLSKKELKDKSQRFFEAVKKNKSMQDYDEKGYGISAKELEMLENATPANSSKLKAYFNNKKKNDFSPKTILASNPADIAAVIIKNRETLFKNIFYYLDYFEEELEADKKSNSSGLSVFAKWKGEMNDWIGMLDKARQHYKEFKDLFFDETALNKTVKAYEKQFKMYEGQFMEIMKKANINSLKEWISTEDSYIRGLEAIIEEVDKKIGQANGKDKKELQEFRFQMSQKISNEQVANIKKSIERFIEEVDRQMDSVRGRIDIWEKIFDKTSNVSLADKFAKAFSGSGSRDAVVTLKNGFETLLWRSLDLMEKGNDKKGESIMNNIIKMFGSDVLDFSAIELAISDPDVPLKVRSEMLKIFKDFKQANQQILESGLEFYEKTRTIEEKRMDVYVKGQQRINDILKMPVAQKLKDNLIENVLKGVKVQMADLQLEAIKSSDIYLELFNNIKNAGVGCLKMLRDQLEALKDSFKDDPVKLKALNSELKKIDDKLQPKQYSLKDMFSIPSKKDYMKAIQGVEEARKQVSESQQKEMKLSQKRIALINKREAERNSNDMKDEITRRTMARVGVKTADNKEGYDERYEQTRKEEKAKMDAEIDAKYKSGIEGLDDSLKKQSEETAKGVEKLGDENKNLLDLEIRRRKAIEQMMKQIEVAFKFSNELLDFGKSAINALQSNKIFQGKNSDGNMFNTYTNDIVRGIEAVQNYNNAFKGIMDNGLKLWDDISGAIADKNGRNAIQNMTPIEHNTSALLELTNVINQWRMNIEGGSSNVSTGFDSLYGTYVNKMEGKDVDKKKPLNGKMLASMGLGVGLAGIGAIGSGDYRSGAKGAMSSTGSALFMTGEPTTMAIGAALQIGSAIWDAADKIHDSDIDKAIENLQDKFDALSDVITETNNKIRKSTGNQVISGKRENIDTQQKQLKNLEQQMEKAKQRKGSNDKEIKEYEKKIKQLTQSIKEAEMDLFESILGSGIDEYMKNLVSVFEEAAKSGENTFKALKNNFSEALSSMVQDTIMTTIIKNRMQKFFDQVEQISKQGGMGIGMTDDIIATGLEAMQDVNSDLRNMQPLIRQINTAFGVASSTAGSLASGVKGMSEETAGQMSGYLIANFDRLGEIQKSVFAIEKVVAGNTASGMMTQYQTDAITHLAQIEANTLRNAEKVEQFYNLINSMKVVNTNGSGAAYGIQTVN